MGLILCPKCDKELGFSSEPPHACRDEDVVARVKELEAHASLAEHRLREIQNAVQMLLSTLPSLDGEKAEVETRWLRKLFDRAEGRFDRDENADQFLVRWLATQWVLCDAFDVFRSKKGDSPLRKLANLERRCRRSAATLGYAETFDVAAETLLEQHRKEKP